jgi:hypothetical protein
MEFSIKEQIKSSPTQNESNSSSSISSSTIITDSSPTKSSTNNNNNNREKRIFTNGTLSSIAQSSSTTTIETKQQPNILSSTKLMPIKMINNCDNILQSATTTEMPKPLTAITLSPKNQQQLPSCVPALNNLMNKLNNYQHNIVASSFSTSSGSSSSGSSSSSSSSSFKLNTQQQQQQSQHQQKSPTSSNQQFFQIPKEPSLSPVVKLPLNDNTSNKLSYPSSICVEVF